MTIALSRKPWARAALFVVAFGTASMIVWAIAEVVVIVSGVTRNGTGLDLPPRMAAWKTEITNDHGPRRVAMLGDSMLLGPPGFVAVPDRVDAFLRHENDQRKRATVHSVWFPVLWPIGEYCLASDVVEGRPELAVFELNLRGLQPGPLNAYSYAEVAGWIDWRHIPEALLLPLGDAGLTANRLLFYRLLVSAHLEGRWESLISLEARLVNSRDTFETWLDRRVGGLTTAKAAQTLAFENLGLFIVPSDPHRGTAAFYRVVLGQALDGMGTDTPRMRVLGALVHRFHEAGIPILIWVSPVNVKHLESLGVRVDGLDRTVESARAVVEANGGMLVDLHAALPDSGFRDVSDHFSLAGPHSGGAIVAWNLARAIVQALEPARAPTQPPEVARALQ